MVLFLLPYNFFIGVEAIYLKLTEDFICSLEQITDSPSNHLHAVYLLNKCQMTEWSNGVDDG